MCGRRAFTTPFIIFDQKIKEFIMRYEKIELEGYGEKFFLEAYVADRVGDFVRSAMLVIPGGGYGCVCSDREGEPIAQAFMPYGYNSFVLHYTVGKKPFPCQLIQASVAMRYIKEHASELCIDPARVFVSGYSAGGHLAASLGTMWHKDFITKETGMEYGINAPTGMMLIYPVISAELHGPSFNNLLMNDSPSENELKACSVENSVDDRLAPPLSCIPRTTRSLMYVIR